MMGRRPEHPPANATEISVLAAAPNTELGLVDELDGLSIEEMEPRLTPDGWDPLGWVQRQVGWGC